VKRSQSSANYSVVVRQVFRQTTRMEVNIWMDAMCNVIAEVGIIFLLKPFDCRVTVPSHFGRIGPPTTLMVHCQWLILEGKSENIPFSAQHKNLFILMQKCGCDFRTRKHA
jgi:hypothetical protein